MSAGTRPAYAPLDPRRGSIKACATRTGMTTARRSGWTSATTPPALFSDRGNYDDLPPRPPGGHCCRPRRGARTGLAPRPRSMRWNAASPQQLPSGVAPPAVGSTATARSTAESVPHHGGHARRPRLAARGPRNRHPPDLPPVPGLGSGRARHLDASGASRRHRVTAPRNGHPASRADTENHPSPSDQEVSGHRAKQHPTRRILCAPSPSPSAARKARSCRMLVRTGLLQSVLYACVSAGRGSVRN